MNIFYLDKDPKIAAKYHCDKHCVKMILETAQILSAVHARYGSTSMTYKETHKNHPSTLWAGDGFHNYRWLWNLGNELCKEYTNRYHKVHKCYWMFHGELLKAPEGIPNVPFEDPPQCMPDECKTFDDTVEAYKNYYRIHKARFAKWKTGEVPSFMEGTTI